MIVVDASVVVKLLTEEHGSDLAIDRISREPERTAPDWLQVEIASALAKKVRYAGLPTDQAQRSLAAIPAVMPDIVSSTPLLGHAMELSIALRHALYDCLYLALAIREDCAVLTADIKFFEAAGRSEYYNRVELLA